jgi:hypothetical protein
LQALLRATGIGVASFGVDGALIAANDVFREFARLAPGASQAMRLRATQEARPVESLRFERQLGWLRWSAHPVDDGVAIQVSRASEEDLRVDRLASKAAEDSGLPSRAALNVELEVTWHEHARHALMVVEPQALPGELPLPRDVAERAVANAAAVLSARLLDGEGIYRLSPLTLAVLTDSRHERERMGHLLSVGNEALKAIGREMPLIAGCASRASAANPAELCRHASFALLDARLNHRIGAAWYEAETDEA